MRRTDNAMRKSMIWYTVFRAREQGGRRRSRTVHTLLHVRGGSRLGPVLRCEQVSYFRTRAAGILLIAALALRVQCAGACSAVADFASAPDNHSQCPRH